MADESITTIVTPYLCVTTHVKKSTLGVYQRHIETHIIPFFKDMHYSQLNKEILQGFINNELMGLSLTTIRSIFYLLKNALKGKASLDVFNVEFLNCSNEEEIESFSINEQKSFRLKPLMIYS